MAKKLFVGNLPYSTTDQDLRDAFSKFGTVVSAQIIMEKQDGQPTGRSRGFGFVEMDDAAAEAAIGALNGAKMGERAIVVNEARPMAPRSDFRRSEARDDWRMAA